MKRSKRLIVAVSSILLASPIFVASCSLDSRGTGLFDPAGDSGVGGEGGKKPCDCPPTGGSSSGGTGASGGVAGSSGTAGGAGSTGGSPAGSGGAAGSAGTAGGSGGTGGSTPAGSGGDAGIGGEAGSSGSSGAGGCPSCCGNHIREDKEVCDDKDLGGATCTSIPGGFNGGTLTCKSDCKSFDTSACTKALFCGDKLCNNGETCSSCSADCGVCPSTCGNNLIEGTEVCDGTALAGLDCTTIPKGFSGGTLSCKADCSNYDTTLCLPPATCNAGDSGTVDKITASGVAGSGILLHYALAADKYVALPSTESFSGTKLPGQFVLAGKDGLNFSLFNGTKVQAMVWYKVNMGDLPGLECGGFGGVNIPSQACLTQVAKSFRCQFAPYKEATGCPTPIGFTAQPAASMTSNTTSDWQIILVDLTCP